MIETLHVEEAICSYLGRRFCFLVGHGSTSIHLALKVIERKVGRGEIILPTVACASLSQTASNAGFTPVFADVRLADFTLSAESFRSRITRDTRAVLPIHIYGHPAPMTEIGRIAADHGVFVIEDAAQSVGGLCSGRKMGALGDFSILSFGGGKILEAGSGGALLTDNTEFVPAIREEIARLPDYPRSIEYDLRCLSRRNHYHAAMDLLRTDPQLRVDPMFRAALPFYRDLSVHKFPDDEKVLEKISRGFETLDAENALRIERAERYHALLSDCQPDLALFDPWRTSRVLWRYTFLVKDPSRLLSVTEALRKNGIHASNHYWSLADLHYGEKDHPNTSYICPRLLNLWVDETATECYIGKTGDVIGKSLR